jgi:hypothetical protein
MLNTHAVAGFLRYITWLKLGVLGLIVVWALVFRLGLWSNFVPFVAQRSGSSPLLPRCRSVTSDHTFVAQAGAVLFGRAGANLLTGAVVLCVVGGMAAMILLCPRACITPWPATECS